MPGSNDYNCIRNRLKKSLTAVLLLPHEAKSQSVPFYRQVAREVSAMSS